MVVSVTNINGDTRKFSGLEGSKTEGFPIFDRARILRRCNGQEIVYQQGYSRDGPYVLIPGYLVSKIIVDESGRHCNVFPIKDESEREYIKDLLAAKTIGEVNFWN